MDFIHGPNLPTVRFRAHARAVDFIAESPVAQQFATAGGDEITIWVIGKGREIVLK